MPSGLYLPARFRWQNRAVIERLTDGYKEEYPNTVADNFRAAVAAAIAEAASGYPTHIAVGKGTMTENALSNRTSVRMLGIGGGGFGDYSELAQGFQVASSGPVNSVVLNLRRLGASAGTLTVEIQSDSSSLPSGTPVTNGTSDAVPINYLETATNGGWVRFVFATPPQLVAATQYHLVLTSSGYSPVDNVLEIVWGVDTSPAYASGTLHGLTSFPDWQDLSEDAIFKVIRQTDGLMAGLSSELVRGEILSRSKYNPVTARLLTNFGTADAVDYIGEIALYDAASGGNLLAIANATYDKSVVSSGINVYWLIEILAEEAA